jgi:hypothetical protein
MDELMDLAGLSDNARWLLNEGAADLGDIERVLRTSGTDWADVQRAALSHTLVAAKRSSFHSTRVALSEAEIAADPEAALLAFPALTKRIYWDHAAELRLEHYDDRVAHRFHTSGTELGTPTEQPWDEWTFRRSFCESSAMALTRSGVTKESGVILGSPGFGALAKSYAWACQSLGLALQGDGSAFSDMAEFAAVIRFIESRGADTLVATPGGTVAFIRALRENGLDPKRLGIRRVISGIGNFLTDRHLAFIVQELDPDVVIEQGGKNEILHAPGAVRHDKRRPQHVCHAGFLHYLPHVSHVYAVDREAFAQGRLEPVGHDRLGILLMTRLGAGQAPIVAFVNDAGDLGLTKGIGGTDCELCPCGSPLPAFRFSVRVSACLSNRLGDTLFTEEFARALATVCSELGVAGDLAASLRLQVVLVRDAAWDQPDRLYWIIGTPPALAAQHQETLRVIRDRMIEYWVSYATYAGSRYARYMTLGRGVIVDQGALPHAGRDKPQYKLEQLVEAEPGQDLEAAFVNYLARGLRANIILT